MHVCSFKGQHRVASTILQALETRNRSKADINYNESDDACQKLKRSRPDAALTRLQFCLHAKAMCGQVLQGGQWNVQHGASFASSLPQYEDMMNAT